MDDQPEPGESDKEKENMTKTQAPNPHSTPPKRADPRHPKPKHMGGDLEGKKYQKLLESYFSISLYPAPFAAPVTVLGQVVTRVFDPNSNTHPGPEWVNKK